MSTATVDAAGEASNDCDKVSDEDGLGFGNCRTENHEPCSGPKTEPFDKIESESDQSVTVGNHNLFDVSPHHAFQ